MFSKSVQHFAYFSCRERKWPFLNFEMAQLAIETLEDLYNNLTILQFWKDRPPTPFLEYVEYCKKDLRDNKNTLFLQILQFLISQNATWKELKHKWLLRLPGSLVEHREFMNNAVEFLSSTFPELHLGKSSFTGSKIVETLRIISIRTLANLCKQRDLCCENSDIKYDDETRVRALKLLIANEVRKHQQLKADAQQKRKKLLLAVKNIRKNLESIVVHFDTLKAGNEVSSDSEYTVCDDEQVANLTLSYISKFNEMLSSAMASEDKFNSPSSLKSSDLQHYQTLFNRNILRLTFREEDKVEDERSSYEVLQSSATQETCAMDDAVYDFIRKAESIIPQSLHHM